MIGRFVIVWVGAALEQEACELRVVCNPRRAVERAFPHRSRLVVLFIEPRLRACAGVEQSLRRTDERVGPLGLEPQVVGETKMRERIPTARASLRRRTLGIGREKPAHRLVVTQDRRGVHIAAGDFRMFGQDLLGAFQGAVPNGGFNERRPRIVDIGHRIYP
jgi:hypothetical protein